MPAKSILLHIIVLLEFPFIFGKEATPHWVFEQYACKSVLPDVCNKNIQSSLLKY